MKNIGRLIMIKVDFKDLKRVELKEEDIDQYIKYVNVIKSKMPNPDFIMDLTKDYIIDLIKADYANNQEYYDQVKARINA